MLFIITKVKYVVFRLIRAFIRIKYFQLYYFWVWRRLPIDTHLVLVESANTKCVDGNMFYVLQELLKNISYKDYTICVAVRFKFRFWLRRRLKVYHLPNIRMVFWGWPNHSRALATAHFIFADSSLHQRYVKKAGQLIWNTWHGTPLKTMGRWSGYSVGYIQKTIAVSDYLTNPNEYTECYMLKSCIMFDCLHDNTINFLVKYPRNTVLFDKNAIFLCRNYLVTSNIIKLYAWLPTWRHTFYTTIFTKIVMFFASLLPIINQLKKKYTQSLYQNNMCAYLSALDKQLLDHEILLFKSHDFDKQTDFTGLHHIRPWPDDLETYHVLSACDVLISDYSSVMFDFAETRRKIVRFEFDLADYAERRGFAIDPDALPFPRVDSVSRLADELRSPKGYDDTEFLLRYCTDDSPDVVRLLLEQIMLGKPHFPPRHSAAERKKSILARSPELVRTRISSGFLQILLAMAQAGHAPLIALDAEEERELQNQLAELPERIGYIVAALCPMRRYPVKTLLRILPGALQKSAASPKSVTALEFEALRSFGAFRLDAILILDESGGIEFIHTEEPALAHELASLLQMNNKGEHPTCDV